MEQVSKAVVQKVLGITDALFLNGSASFDEEDGTILAVDSLLGCIYRIFVRGGRFEVWLQHDLFKKPTDSVIPGINGIKYYQGRVLCSNTDARTMICVDLEAGRAEGEPKLLFDSLNVDHLALDKEGVIYATTHIF
jgi:sugar lactone lactonase YvrE